MSARYDEIEFDARQARLFGRAFLFTADDPDYNPTTFTDEERNELAQWGYDLLSKALGMDEPPTEPSTAGSDV